MDGDTQSLWRNIQRINRDLENLSRQLSKFPVHWIEGGSGALPPGRGGTKVLMILTDDSEAKDWDYFRFPPRISPTA